MAWNQSEQFNRDASKIHSPFAPYRFLGKARLKNILAGLESSCAKTLSLKYCKDAMEYMVPALSKWKHANLYLTELRFHNCNIGPYLPDIVRSLIEHTPNLSCLSLNNNPLDDAAFDAVILLLKTKKLKYLNLENTQLTASMIAKLAHTLEHDETGLEYLDLSSNHLLNDEIQALMPALASITNLTVILSGDNGPYTEETKAGLQLIQSDYRDIVLPEARTLVMRIRPTEDITRFMQWFASDSKKSTIVDLAHNSVINPHFTRKFNEFLRSTKTTVPYQSLTLDNNFLSVTDDFRQIIAGLAEKAPSLTELYLRSNGLQAADLEDLHLPRSVQTLNLENNPLGPDGMVEVVRMLRENNLTVLDLEATQMGNAGAITLAEDLSTNTSLKRLVIQNNDIEDVGARALIKALRENESIELQHLDIEANYQISTSVMLEFARLILEKPSITSYQGWCNMPDTEILLGQLMYARAQLNEVESDARPESLHDAVRTAESNLLAHLDIETKKQERFKQQVKRQFSKSLDLVEDDAKRKEVLAVTSTLQANPHSAAAQEGFFSIVQKYQNPKQQKIANALMILGAMILIGAGAVLATSLTTGISGLDTLTASIISGVAGGAGAGLIGIGLFANKKQTLQKPKYSLRRQDEDEYNLGSCGT